MISLRRPDARAPLVRTLLSATLLALAGLGSISRAAPVDNNPPPGWWQNATFYEIFVRSFADADSGTLAGDGIGDLQGLIDHLDYLNDGRGTATHSLGVNAVWLMPIMPSPSYHGYDVTDYFSVNPQYGDLALMKKFVAAAHRRGIRVIIDLVLNHCSTQNALFREAVAGKASARAMFRFAPLPEQLYGPWGQEVWHPINGEFYYGVFSPEMPDWNFRSPRVTAQFRRCAEFWLRDVGVDGFRLDAVRYFVEDGDELQDTPETLRWLQGFTAYCHSIKPGAFVVSENTGPMTEISQYIRSKAVDSSFAFDLEKATVQSLQMATPGILMQALNRMGQLYAGESPWSSIIDNHDQERIMSQLGGDPVKAKLAAKVLFTLPGVPFVYYGEELGMTGDKPDPELRTPMPWNTQPNAGFTTPETKPWHPLTGDPAQVNVATEAVDPNSMLTLYRRLIRLNAGSPALRHGTPVAITTSDYHVYATMRQTPGEAVLILGNFSDKPMPGPTLSARETNVRAGWSRAEEIDPANVTPVSFNEEGGFRKWQPVAELAPNSVSVIRWTAPAAK